MPKGLSFIGLKEKINKEGIKLTWIAKTLGIRNNTVTDWVNGRAFPKKSEHLTFLLRKYGPLELMDRTTETLMYLEVDSIGEDGKNKKDNEVTGTD